MKALLFALNASFAHQALGALTIASYANKCAGEDICSVLECNVNELSGEILYKLYENAKNKRIAGFSCYVWNIEKMLRLAEILKKLLPGLYIAFGGPEVSFYEETEFYALYPFVDFLICGEGEIKFFELCERILFFQGV